MRSLTGVIIAGAIVLIIAVAVSLQMGPAGPQYPDASSPPGGAATGREPKLAAKAPASDAGAPGPAKNRRSARVEERLERLREADRDKVRVFTPSTRGQDLPQRELVMPPSAAGDPAQDYPEDLDDDEREEFDSIKETLLNNPDPDERIGAILMLTGMEGEPAWRLLADSMQDPDAEVRLAVVEALGDYSDDLQPDILAPALNDADAEVRFEAYGILGDMESPEAMALVRSGLQDPDEDVRALAEGILDFSDEE
jgi:hypothetical protein